MSSTKLIEAVEKADVTLVKQLCLRGVDINQTNDNDTTSLGGLTPLHISAANGNLEITLVLLKSGARSDIASTNGRIPLHRSAYYGHLAITKLLLKYGSDINARTTSGWTPLHNAVYSHHTHIIKYLLESGADCMIKNDSARSAYDLATDTKIRSMIKLHLDTRKQKWFVALNSDESRAWNSFRLMIVGQGKCGKTSLVRSLFGKEYNPTWDSTVGADIIEGCGSTSRLIWKEGKTLNHATKFAAQTMLELLHGEGDSETKNCDDIAIGSLKPDQEPLAKSLSELEEKEQSIKPDFKEHFLVDAKEEGSTFTVWDFGGQEIFYTMHHIFMTERGIYIIVFDMREILNPAKSSDARRNISFWFRSIKLHAPKSSLLVVGSFAQEIDSQEDIQDINRILADLGKEFHSQVILNTNENLIFFPVDNSDGRGIKNVHLVIEKVSRSDKVASQSVSINWMTFLDSMKSLEAKHIPLSNAYSLAYQVGIHRKEEQKAALELFHERGVLLHLAATETMKNIVILEPQWILDALSKIIRDKSIHKFDAAHAKDVGLLDDANTMFGTGILSRDLLSYLWGEMNNYEQEFLIDFMRHSMLLNIWSFSQEESYFIPCLVTDKRKSCDDIPGIKCIFDFSKTFLPYGIFHRLLCLCLAHSSKTPTEREPEIFQNFASIEIGSGIVLKLFQDVESSKSITIFLEQLEYAAKCLSMLESMLNKLNQEVFKNRLSWMVLVEDPYTEKVLRREKAQRTKLWPWFPKRKDTEQDYSALTNVNIDSFLEKQ